MIEFASRSVALSQIEKESVFDALQKLSELSVCRAAFMNRAG
jgi:hypothetical protein